MPDEALTDLFVEQHRRVLQLRQHHRRIERGVEPSLRVALIGALGDAPAQIENAARLDDIEQTADRRRDLLAVEMHDHGFAQHVVEGADAAQLGQFGLRELERRVTPPRLGEQAFRGIEADGRKTVRMEPGDLAAAAAADIGRIAAADEKPLDDFLQVDRRRLTEPVLRERRRILVVSGERLTVHDLAFDLRKIRDRAGRRADLVQKL